LALLGGVVIAVVGWLDDRRGLKARTRAAAHFLAGAWAVAWLGGVPSVTFGPVVIQLGMFGNVLAVIGTVWFINLFNFMDGIDGIAAGEAAVVGLFAALYASLTGAASVGLVFALIAGCCCGFLVWNWQPARVFMGDVASGFLGYCLAVLALAGERTGGVPLLYWLLLVSPFAFDGTTTLVRRVVRGEPWYEAHRSHAYQRAVIAGFSHRQVAGATVFLSAMLGAAGLSLRLDQRLGPIVLLVALALLAIIYLVIERRSPMFASSAKQ
jgi:Fuc2NAc and GlcNAc transferase